MKHLGQIVELFVNKDSDSGRISLALIKTKKSIRILKLSFPEHLIKGKKK